MAIKKVPYQKKEGISAMEIYMLRTCNHPNIAQFHEAFRCGDDLWIVLEAMIGGCLTDVLTEIRNYPLTESHMANVCKEVCRDRMRGLTL